MPAQPDCSVDAADIKFINFGPNQIGEQAFFTANGPPVSGIGRISFPISGSVSGVVQTRVLSAEANGLADGGCSPTSPCKVNYIILIENNSGPYSTYWKEVSNVKSCSGQSDPQALDPTKYSQPDVYIYPSLEASCGCSHIRQYRMFNYNNDQPIDAGNGEFFEIHCRLFCKGCPGECEC